MDELDLALVNALQLDPRAPWSRLAGPLGVDAATLSRRWARLRTAGDAWVTCYAGASQVAYGAFALVEVVCAGGAAHRVAAGVAADPHALSVEQTTGSRDLLLTVSATEPSALGDYVLRRLGTLDGVAATRTHLVQRLHREASRWRLDSLSHEQRRDLERVADRDREPGPLRPEELRLMLALGADGRLPYARLAERLGVSETRVRRTLAGMLGGERVVMRCETAHRLAGWRVTGMLWLNVPPTRLGTVAEHLAALREARMVCSVVGEANLLVNVWVHALDDLAALETRLLTRFPEVRVLDRSVTLRWVKRMGRMLDDEGRGVGYVPMDIRAPVTGRT
ncbi:MAG TPA: Lrp/AsnC family transcriptional regulator [Thermomonospora sp.]|nr:Lrp/AsnC family transcriptional regulator [Thermomonospora sp.]